MGMRRETLKALEQVRDHVVTERKQSKMQTLGASNPHNNNRDKHRSAILELILYLRFLASGEFSPRIFTFGNLLKILFICIPKKLTLNQFRFVLKLRPTLI
jgi:hypothetical protein